MVDHVTGPALWFRQPVDKDVQDRQQEPVKFPFI